MTKDEHNSLLTELRTADEATRMSLIVKLEQDYSGVLNQVDTTTKDLEKVTKERDDYKSINNQQWLRISAQDELLRTDNELQTNITQHNNSSENAPKKRTYADLKSKF